MKNFEASPSSSAKTSASSSTSVAKSSGPSKFSFDSVIAHIDDVLSAITNKSLRSKMQDGGMKLRDMVEPIASDFSKLCEGISQGAKMFSDQKYLTNNLSSEAHTVALDVLKGVGNAHWTAVGLLAIANVLERLDKISTNDRECIDLLKGMLDLAKFIKMLKDINADFHTEMLAKMSEALHLIVSGAILCHSFIRCNKISKFLLTKTICEELVYVRGKVDRMKNEIGLQMNYMIVSSITFHLSKQHQHNNDDDGGLQQQQTTDRGDSGETEEVKNSSPINPSLFITSETEISTTMSEQEIRLREAANQSDLIHNSNKKIGYQLREMLPRILFAFGRYLKYTANGVKNFGWHKFLGCQKPEHTLSLRLDDEQLSTFAIEQGFQWLSTRFTIQELETATNNFCQMLGKGGFGYAYRGTLSNGREVVIKRSRKRTGELVRELVCIANLQHRNILKLVGFCTTGVELLLVYDYMPNGNLSDLLFNPAQNQVLEWSTRRKIIEGVISAVVYLHDGADVSIVHRDIKPTNILLDHNFNAKVSDFGIARTLHNRKSAPIGGTHEGIAAMDGDTDCSTTAAGTVGYVAPECFSTGHVTKKADIFSFGLLLLNVVSGKRCLEFTDLDDGMYNLTDQAFKFHRENRLMELIDIQLVERGNFDGREILNIMKTALWCIQPDPNLRPSASRLSAMLLTEEEIRPPVEKLVNEYQSSLSPPDSPKASVELEGPR